MLEARANNSADLITYTATLEPGSVNSHDFLSHSFAAGVPFYAAIDNSLSGVDTYLGTFDKFGNNIATDDFGSPFGNGDASALTGELNDEGSAHFQVTGFGDESFDGSHTDSGEYDLLLFFGAQYLNGSDSDIDFLSFTDLTPGEALRADITFAGFESTLGWFDAFGNLLERNYSLDASGVLGLDVIVPENGILTFAVSAFPDTYLDGGLNSHHEQGYYQLELSGFSAVPVPAAVWLFGSGLLGLIAVARRKNV